MRTEKIVVCRAISMVLAFLVSTLFCCTSQGAELSAQEETPAAATQEQESVIETQTRFPETKNPEINRLLRMSLTNMLEAAHDVESFIARKGTETKDVLGRITEDIITGTERVNRIVHFVSGEGPIQYAHKRVFTNEGGVEEELKDKSYVLYFYPDGKIESFMTRGNLEQGIDFYPSGKIKQYDLVLVEGEKSIVAIGWNEDDTIKYEKYAPEHLQNKIVP